MTMNRIQELRYKTSKEQFKEQMDPTDLSRAFYVNQAGYVIGFDIVRSDGFMLEYNAEENKYYLLNKDEPSKLDLQNNALNLPPYECWQNREGQVKYKETHAFPDLSTNALYGTLRFLRKEHSDEQFSIALAMTDLLSCELNENELTIMANKAVKMLTESPHGYLLKEITSALNELLVNGLSGYPVGTARYDYDGPTVKNALLAADQESFNNLVAYTAEENREVLYHGTALPMYSMAALTEEMSKILPYLGNAEREIHGLEADPLDNRIESAQHRAATSSAASTVKEKTSKASR